MDMKRPMHEYNPATGKTTCRIQVVPDDYTPTEARTDSGRLVYIATIGHTITCKGCSPKGPKLLPLLHSAPAIQTRTGKATKPRSGGDSPE
jgi:hypothetical protein